MALTPGTRIGVYDVTAQIGAGGMGEVYRATDTKLKRQVAIKILPPSVAADHDRLARFQREAEVLASLNHPQIAGIYGLEESEGVFALVMELVEGDDLSQRIARGAIPLHDAVPIAKQIADALEAAHEQGIIHRDLKPANIKVRADGTVKVLDFGLAKAMAPAGVAPAGTSHSVNITTPAMTQAGMILGTAAYMSPEQTRGKSVDKRTDIWAFGCVLYEMLTGRPAFIGETTTDVLAKIVEREPDWTKLPPSTPPRLARLLRRCFDKDPKRRARDIGDVRMELDDETGAPSGPTPIATLRTLKAVAASASVVAALLAIAVGVLWFGRTPAVHAPTQFSFEAPSGEVLELSPPVPAPDGRRVAFVARDAAGQRALWIRRLDSLVPQRVAGTEGAIGAPFWSPDGRFVGFFGEGKLKKADLSGGAVLNICGITANLGATWSPDNVIVLAPVNRTVLHRVPAAGGTPEPITTLSAERKENSHRWPHFLPDGRHFLFTARSDVKENNLIYVGSLDSKAITPLRAAQSNAVYVSPGYLLFAQEGTLMAQRFDARALTLAGDPFPVAEHVAHNTPSSSGSFGASVDGSIVTYLPGGSRLAQLSWFDRSGTRVGQPVGPPRNYDEIRLSPDGRRVVVEMADPDSGNRDLWMLDAAAGGLTRVTSNPANDWQAAWSPDSRELVFASDRNGRSTVYRKAIDGGDDQLLLQSPDMGVFPSDWSADGRFIALNADLSNGNLAIWALPLSGDHTPFPLLQSSSRAGDLTISPDGRWVAYQSSESSPSDIYVKPFTGASRTRVSAGGGFVPRWRRDGRELFYITAGDIMSVAIAPGDTLQPAAPVRLFAACAGVSPATRGEGVGSSRAMYDVAADGSRFLLACALADATPPRITVSIDWAATLK